MLSRLRLFLTRSESSRVTPRDGTYPFVYVEFDGTARELRLDERRHLETEFELGDGNAPYVKTAYEERNGWGALDGYIYRSKLPAGMSVKSAPPDGPIRWLDRE